MLMYSKGMRKDGKLNVVYVFPLSGTRIVKICTPEKFAADWKTAENNPHREKDSDAA